MERQHCCRCPFTPHTHFEPIVVEQTKLVVEDKNKAWDPGGPPKESLVRRVWREECLLGKAGKFARQAW